MIFSKNSYRSHSTTKRAVLYEPAPGIYAFQCLAHHSGTYQLKDPFQSPQSVEELGFVNRQAFLEIPPRVEYHLTAKGRELGDVIAALEQFGNKHLSGDNLPGCDALDDELPSTQEVEELL